MTWIKICGTTNLEDALTAVEEGADALGFVFYPNSPRKIEPEEARGIVEKLPAIVEKVGVFVNESIEAVAQTVRVAGLSGVQLHGNEDQDYARSLCQSLGSTLRIYGALPMNHLPTPSGDYGWDAVSSGALSAEAAEMFTDLWRDRTGEEAGSASTYSPGVFYGLILDAGGAGEGGTGKTFDWEKARPFVNGMGSFINIIVAGGLNSANVARMIRTLHPWGVDVASGVEKSPGRKDQEKIRAFVAAVRESETSY